MLESPIKLYRRHQKYLMVLIVFCFLGWFLTPYVHIFLGLKLGIIIGWFNHWLLMRRTQAMTETANTNRQVHGTGMAVRMSSALLATIIATELPGYFHIYSMAIGLGIVYAVIFLDFVVCSSYRKKKVKK
ncbi:ATP synthase subunit I [Listeria sp. PSOL-1]|uniref:ATP synthase subunit I n=1 Tax=Listeria sp. PSOL-1 TaxID=1844999 RepID=UPI0013D686F2|nr:ATP synthase subunit I [Listeria sp. PSOL-1]